MTLNALPLRPSVPDTALLPNALAAQARAAHAEAPLPPSASRDGAHLYQAYAAALIKGGDNAGSIGRERIAPISPASSFGQWHQHLKRLLQTADFTQWAQANNVDLSKPITLFPPDGGRPGYAAMRLKSPAGSIEYFGATSFNRGKELPLVWPFILQATTALAAGKTYIIGPKDDSAQVSEIAAFYGETVPTNAAQASQRAAQLTQSKGFAGPGTLAFPQEQQELLDNIEHRHAFKASVMDKLMPAFIEKYLNELDNLNLLDEAYNRVIPAQARSKVSEILSQCLEGTVMPLGAGESVSLKQFIENAGWVMPSDHFELARLAQSVTAFAPIQPGNGDLGGALSWAVPLHSDDKAGLYYHPIQTLPDVEDHGLFKLLTRHQVWDKTDLAQPRRVINDILASAAGKAIGEGLQRKNGALATPTSHADWLLAALQVSLDKETLLVNTQGVRHDNIAGFDLANQSHIGERPSTVVQALANHLHSQQKASAELSPVAAYLLLAHRAPAYLVKPIPAAITVGSHSWVSFQVAVARLEAKAPGSTADMTYAEVMTHADRPPVTQQEQAVEYAAQHAALEDWGVANGIIRSNANGQYSPAQMQTVKTAYDQQMLELSAASHTFSTPMPTRREMALAELKKAFGEGIDFEKECLQSTTRAQDRDDVGPHSIVDLYLHKGTTESLAWGWKSTSPEVPLERLKTTRQSPDMNEVFPREFGAYRVEMDKAIATQTKHLIARLPLEDRQRIEFGNLTVMTDTQVSRDPFGMVSENRMPNDRSLLLKTTFRGEVLTYELNLKDNTLIRTGLGDVTLGEHADENGRVYRRYGQVASSPASQSTASNSQQPAGVPASFTSQRTALIADAAVKDADIASYESQARGQTRFESRQPWYKRGRELLLNMVPLYSAIKNFQAGNIGDGIVDLAFDALGFLVVAGTAAKGGKALNTAARSFATLGQVSRTFGRAALGVLNPLDGLGASAFRGGQKAAASIGKLRGTAGRYDLLQASRKYEAAAKGTYKVGEQVSETSAILKNSKWYAFDVVTQQPYGKALNDFVPSAQLGSWATAKDPVKRIDDATVKIWKRTVSGHRSGDGKLAFESGYLNGSLSSVPGLSASSKIEDLMKLAARQDMTAQQVGVLVRRYDEIAYEFGRRGVARFIDNIEPRFGSVIPMPQVVYFSRTGQLSDGQCAGLARAMASAVAEGKEQVLLKNMYFAAAFPSDPASRRFMESLRKLQVQVGAETAFHARKPIRQMTYQNMVKELDASAVSKSVMIDSPDHAMAAGVRVEGGEKTFYFYDPNHGLARFTDAGAMEGGLNKLFNDKKMNVHYKTHGNDRKALEFKVFDHDDAWQLQNSVNSADFKALYEAPLGPSNTSRGLSSLELARNWEVLHANPANKGLICYEASIRVGEAEKRLSPNVFDAVKASTVRTGGTNYSPRYLELMGIKPGSIKTTFKPAEITESGLINFKHAHEGGEFGHTVYVQKTIDNELILFNTNSPELDVAMIRNGNPPQFIGGMQVYRLDNGKHKGLQDFLDGVNGTTGWQFAYTPASKLNANVSRLQP